MTTLSGIYRRVDRHGDYVVETRFIGNIWVTTSAHVEQGTWAPMAIVRSQEVTHQANEARWQHALLLDDIKEMYDAGGLP